MEVIHPRSKSVVNGHAFIAERLSSKKYLAIDSQAPCPYRDSSQPFRSCTYSSWNSPLFTSKTHHPRGETQHSYRSLKHYRPAPLSPSSAPPSRSSTPPSEPPTPPISLSSNLSSLSTNTHRKSTQYYGHCLLFCPAKVAEANFAKYSYMRSKASKTYSPPCLVRAFSF